MRDLKINQRTFYYATYIGEEEYTDDDGYPTGERFIKYNNPILCKASISANKGTAETEIFGVNLNYDKVISTTQKLPLDELSILYVDIMPVINSDGSTNTKFDYYITKISTALNQTLYAIKKVV